VLDANFRVDDPFTLAKVPGSIVLVEPTSAEILEYHAIFDEDWCCVGVQEGCELAQSVAKLRMRVESHGTPNQYGVDPASFVAAAASGLGLRSHTVAYAWGDKGLSRYTPDRVVTDREGNSWRWSDVVNTCGSEDDVEVVDSPAGSWLSGSHFFHVFDDVVCIQRDGDETYTEPPPPPDPELLQGEVCIPRAEWELGLQRIDAGCAANDDGCVVP
jgi:hypothetical protein